MIKYLPLSTGLRTDSNSGRLWRAWSLHLPFLVSFLMLCVMLIISIELIIVGCTGGCHVFGKYSTEKLSSGTSFVYNQLPTAIALALSLLWALPNYHVMRLEPYFQMSAPDGATAANSILLHYPYIFVLFVPFQAAKQGSGVFPFIGEYALTTCLTLRCPTLVFRHIDGALHYQSTHLWDVQRRDD